MKVSLLIAAAAAAVSFAGSASAANLLDDFNRPNQTGSLGPDWTVLKNGAVITGNMASGGTQSLSLYTGSGAYSSNEAEFDFLNTTTSGDTRGYYDGALLNWDGTGGYFIKIQHQSLSTTNGYNQYSIGHVTYNSVTQQFSYTNDSGLVSFGQYITSGHLTASVTGGVGTLTLTGGASPLTFTYAYAPTVSYSGNGIGLGIQDGGRADNFASLAPVPEPATWAMMIGGFGLVGGAMRSARRGAKRSIA